jgi:hypothetical protein
MTDIGLVETLSSLGAGGILALIMFLVYRKDRKSSEDRLTNLLDKEIESREKHTAALTELKVLLEKLNGNDTRRSD